MAYTLCDFRRDLAAPYAWPGGYPKYFLCGDGEPLSFEAAKSEKWQIVDAIKRRMRERPTNDQWDIVACDINWENYDLYCSHTGEQIEAAYGID